MAPPDWKQYTPDETPDGEPGAELRAYVPPPEPPRVRTLEERTVRRTGGSPALIGVAGVVLVGGVTAGIFALSGGSDVAPAPAAEKADEKPDVQSAAGFADLVDAVREKTGTTTVFEVVLYPEYAVVDAPFKPGDVREVTYHWDGALDETGRGNTKDVPYDLAALDGSRFAAMCAAARALVEDPELCYLIIKRPEPEDPTPAWISAYSSNDFQQGGYLEYALDGTEVSRHSW
ncbi:hypothetical protein [Nocardioides sp. LML1-1-1.1]|uniref:hypothetical protein n=1 Tax=Nocardioides sp. LML1-1-1.1 TaxID=3135248 RepID=UPI003431D930